jgi:hypothetical protein
MMMMMMMMMIMVVMMMMIHTYTYHSRFIPKWVAEVSQIFLGDAHVSPKLFSYE